MRKIRLDRFRFASQFALYAVRPTGRPPWAYALLLYGLSALCWLAAPAESRGQCNPSGNPTRYEFNVDPTSMVNLMGQQFCTSQSMGTNCCGAQPSYRCLDLVFNLSNGPMGETFGENCQGMINLMTAQGNFDALYLNVGTPNPAGNSANCAAPINLGNNYVISVAFTGTAMGQISAHLTVTDNMGATVYNTTQTASPGQAVILTICKPGFGCLEDEFVFGCCDAGALLALAPGAPSTICAGGSSTLKVTGLNGVPPYTVMVKAASATDTAYFPVMVNSDMDGNATMDMTTTVVSPLETTVYTALSVGDAAGCVQPVTGQTVMITVNPIPSIESVDDFTVCSGAMAPAVPFSGGPPGVAFFWTNDNPAIGLAASGSGDLPAFSAVNVGNSPITAHITVTPSYTNNGVTCTGEPIIFVITVNPIPGIDAVDDLTACVGSTVPELNFGSAVPGASFVWMRTPEAIGLPALGGMNFVPSFVAANAGATPLVSTFTVVATFTNNGVTCTGTPIEFELTVNPTPTVNPVANLTVCNGALTGPVVFSGAVGGTVFQWVNTNPGIGLAASGAGNIPAFTAVNAGLSSVTATIIVTPLFTFNGVTCEGPPQTFTITVNPTPGINPVGNQSLCSGDLTAPVAFSGAIPGTVFSWTNNNPAIGLAASGTGNIPAFSALNGGNSILVATITVTPTFTGNSVPCGGAPIVFTITVYPRPTVFAGNDLTICQNQQANLAASLGGGATGGLWSGGSGTFANPAAPQTTYTPAAAEYGTSVQLVFTSNDPAGPCPAVSDALILTINTLPIVNAGKDIMICKDEILDLSKLGAGIQANGSGVSTGAWSCSGTGVFQPNNTFAGATSYVPSAADRLAGFVTLTLTSADPAGPCTAVSDQALLLFQPSTGLVCDDNVMVALDEDGMVEITPGMILEGNTVDSIYTVLVLVNGVGIGNKVDCSHIGKTLFVRVTDNCSGVYCTGSVSVVDNLPPKLTCTDVELICAIQNTAPDYLQNVLGIPNAYPQVEENCKQYTLTYHDDWVDLSCSDDYIGYIRRKWTAVDPSGNKGSCTQYLNFAHQHISDVLLPADITLSCSNGPVSTDPLITGTPYVNAYDIPFPIYPDAGYCKLAVTYVDNKLPGCDGTFDLIRTWTVYDWCLPTTPTQPSTNPKYYIQHIRVLDDVGPVLHCPSDRTVSTDPLGCCSTTDLPDIIAADVCSRIKSALARVEVLHPVTGDVLAVYDLNGAITGFPGNNLSDPDTLVAFGLTPCLPLGTHRVTYTVEDACGNTSVCTFMLTVADLTPPVTACDEITQVALGIDGMIFVNATTFDDGSYDNCSDVYFKARRFVSNTCQPNDHFYDQVKFCCEDLNDTIQVILRVYDVPAPGGPVSLDFEEQHSNDCMVQVYVEDKLKPSCVPPANTTVSCENFDPSLWAYGFATGVDNCCIDTILGAVSYNQFDTVCNRGTITRTFQVFDCAGQSTQCTQRIYVNYEQDYYIRFPHDYILTACDGTANFGEPQFFGEDCELLGVSYQDEIFTVVPDACFKIERSWRVINWCTFNPNLPCIYVPNPNPFVQLNHPSNLVGPTVSPAGTPAPWAPTVVKVNPGDPVATDYSTFWSADANCYVYKQIIKITDKQPPTIECPDSTVQFCDKTLNDAQLWNEPGWYDALSGSHDLCEGPADVCINATDACSGANVNVRYLLFLDLDNNGSMETVVSSTNPPDAGTVRFDNAASTNYTGGTVRTFDGRLVAPNQKYRFALQTVANGNKVTACLRWNTAADPGAFVVPELPCGKHKIKWFVEDGCGNEQVCEYAFEVKDCKPPTVTCYNGLSVNLMPTGMIMIDVKSFVENAYDNCTPSDLLIYGIREAGSGLGFPFNPDGTPQTSLTFTCDDLGYVLVEIWAMDLAGNADFCATYIKVQDNIGICGAGQADVAGMLQTENGDGVEDVQVQIQKSASAGQAPVSQVVASDDTGHFGLSNALPLAADVVVAPLKDNDPLNGVSTFDLVLINKHILGLAPLNTPYKMIAADANNSRSITTYDIVELRKLILGIYTELPDNSSWRFIDKGYAFPNAFNPFQEVFPESRTINNVQGDRMEEDFVAVKIGDVNGNAVTSSLLAAPADDRSPDALLFDVQDRLVAPGEVFTVDLQAGEWVSGYQFTLYFPGLEVVDIGPGAGMSPDNFGIFPDEHALTTSFNAGAAGGGAAAFSIRFRARSAGMLSQLLGISSRITRAEAYRDDRDAAAMDVGLRFSAEGNSTVSGVGFELYQNQPNPWTNKTRLGFHLPEPAQATLSIFDETGRLLYVRQDYFSRGYNSISVDNAALHDTGLLYYKLETAGESAVRKMIRTP